jgi:FkbM family methyltransferase
MEGGHMADVAGPDESVAAAFDERYDETALIYAYQAFERLNRAQVLELVQRLGGRIEKPWDRRFDDRTTQADIAYMFRVILGRNPSSALEWRGHGGEVQENVGDIARRYLTSLEFARRNLLTHEKPESISQVTIEGFSIYASTDDRATGANIVAGLYEPHVTALFRRHLRPGMNVVDVGANIGYFTMLSASIVGSQGVVTAIEANPDNARLLEASRRLNGFDNIRIANVAAGKSVGMLMLKTLWSNGIASELRGDSDIWHSRLVPSIPLDRLIPSDRPLDFLKLDIEGGEYAALKGCEDSLRRDRPIIVSEFTPGYLPTISGVTPETYLEFLLGCGLKLAVAHKNGAVEYFGDDLLGMMNAWRASQSDHLDIIAAPEGVL